MLNKTVITWAGEKLLNTSDPIISAEIGFLEPVSALAASQTDEEEQDNEETEDLESKRDVGRLDLVLVNRKSITTELLEWCVVEMQSVYFSGKGMKSYRDHLANFKCDGIPFPDKVRRPDYRSSGPKRLMPQLQIKVPTLRRWGKKLAVVVDRGFMQVLGQMDPATDVSNSDIAWLIVDYHDTGKGRAELKKHEFRLTTLERAVEGLTAGRPVPLPKFEKRIREKLARRQKDEAKVARALAKAKNSTSYSHDANPSRPPFVALTGANQPNSSPAPQRLRTIYDCSGSRT